MSKKIKISILLIVMSIILGLSALVVNANEVNENALEGAVIEGYESSITEMTAYENSKSNGVTVVTRGESNSGLIKVDGQWGYYENGELQTSFTGIKSNQNGTFYVENGVCSLNISGYKKVDDTWYYLKNNKVLTDFTGLAKNHDNGNWYYVVNGIVDFNANDVATNENGTWLVVNGKVDFSANNFIKVKDTWYFFVNGAVLRETTLKKKISTGDWYYIKDGVVDFTYDDFYKWEGYYWYVKRGKVERVHQEYRKSESRDAWYYMENDVVIKDKQGVYLKTQTGVSYYVNNDGRVDFNYTGIVVPYDSPGSIGSPQKNQKRFYVENGVADDTRSKIMTEALKYVGGKYVYGGTSLTNGIDCSAFVQQIYGMAGISVDRTTKTQYPKAEKIGYGSMQPGDLIYHLDGGSPYHVMIYLGNDKVVHAANSKDGIIISNAKYTTPHCARFFN